jgi:hypothetical protein
MKYKTGQAVIISNNDLAVVNSNQPKGMYRVKTLIRNTIIFDKHESEIRPATEAEILAEIQKHGWKQKTSKWLYASPSGQLELMNNDSWQPIIHRSPLPDQFEFFGNECIQAARISKALNLANV